MKTSYLGPFYLTIAASIWGGTYVVSKVVLTVIPALELIWLRYIIALSALLLLCLFSRQSLSIRWKDMPLLFLIGFIGYFLSIWAQFVGTHLASAQMGAVITAATPALMVVFARFLLKETITWRKGLSVLLASAGVILIAGFGSQQDASLIGGLILGFAAITWALMSVLIKLVPARYSSLLITTYAIFTATLTLTPFVYASLPNIPWQLIQEDPTLWSGLFYLGVISTAGAFHFWNKGLLLVEASKSGIYFFFQPLVGTWLGWLLLGEEVTLGFWAGTSFILLGVLLILKK
ncbi:MAG: DMT family transporter [Sporomusaceae bacterium]|nr:DMT family transporter [Sporomusaceae bacterium]